LWSVRLRIVGLLGPGCTDNKGVVSHNFCVNPAQARHGRRAGRTRGAEPAGRSRSWSWIARAIARAQWTGAAEQGDAAKAAHEPARGARPRRLRHGAGPARWKGGGKWRKNRVATHHAEVAAEVDERNLAGARCGFLQVAQRCVSVFWGCSGAFLCAIRYNSATHALPCRSRTLISGQTRLARAHGCCDGGGSPVVPSGCGGGDDERGGGGELHHHSAFFTSARSAE
jgi:hypothetical protein